MQTMTPSVSLIILALGKNKGFTSVIWSDCIITLVVYYDNQHFEMSERKMFPKQKCNAYTWQSTWTFSLLYIFSSVFQTQ